MQTLWQNPRYIARLIMAGLVIGVLLTGFTATGAQDAPAAQTQKAAAIIAELQRALEEEVTATPSLPGELLHIHAPKLGIDRSFAVGMFDRQSKRPLEPHHVFRIASVTKTFVAAAVLRLHEDGKLNIDDPIHRYLPKEYTESLEAGGYATRAITLRHLLTHTSVVDESGLSQTANTANDAGNPRRKPHSEHQKLRDGHFSAQRERRLLGTYRILGDDSVLLPTERCGDCAPSQPGTT